MNLPDTKERALPAHQVQTLEDHLVYLKQVALYKFAATYCVRKRVLDLGCGEGYGSDALARAARFVVAADYSRDAVAHARQKYARPNLAFVVCDAQHLPFRAESFETIISFEVIEHIPNVRAYLEEIRRVSVAASAVILSTPNRALRLLPFQKPWNRFHLREYDARGLARVLGALFRRAQMRGISAIPAIMEIEKRRVKQNPLVAYPRMFAQMLLPRAAYDRMKRIKSQNASTPRADNFRALDFSADDFQISEAGLRECITLVGICER
jgi:ubiquinone/menaquinone biosynthesis C-methylase UbiE